MNKRNGETLQESSVCITNARAWDVYFDVGGGTKAGSFHETLKKLSRHAGMNSKVCVMEVQEAMEELIVIEPTHTEPTMPVDKTGVF